MFAFGSLLQAFASWFDDEDGQEATQVRQRLLDFARIEGIAALLPTVLFDPAWYRAANGLDDEYGNSAADTVRHYLEVGSAAGRDPTSWFDERYYLDRYPDVARSVARQRWRCGYHHYLTRGLTEYRSPNREFNELGYLGSNPDVLEAVRERSVPNGFLHFQTIGLREKRSAAPPRRAALLDLPIAKLPASIAPTGTFAESLYLAANPDVQPDGQPMRGLRHWTTNGVSEDLRGVRPRVPGYVEASYLRANPDIAESVSRGHQPSGYNHFLMYGATEGRSWPGARKAELERHHLLRALRTRSATDSDGPLISVIVPVFNPAPEALQGCIDSVRTQTYRKWELCLADDGSSRPETAQALVAAERQDSRIKVTFLSRNGGIARASNAALEMAGGNVIALLDHDDMLAPDALLHVAQAFSTAPDVDLVYTDEAKLAEDGEPFGLNAKPDWSPELLLSTMYIGHLTAYRRRVIEQVGGFRPLFDGTQDYDLALRAAEVVRSVVHVPLPLYFWRVSSSSTAGSLAAKPGVLEVQREALESTLLRRGWSGSVSPGHGPGHWRVLLDPPEGDPLVSVVIPTAGRTAQIGGTEIDLAATCIRSIEEFETYPHYEIVLVHNGDLEASTLQQLAASPRVRLVAYNSPVFNLSEKINQGVAAAAGDFVLLMNDDMQVASSGMIRSLIGRMFDGVGCVGARLLYANGTLQHAGIVWTAAGPTHAMIGEHRLTSGPAERLRVLHNCFGVSGACVLFRKSVYLQVGGFSEALPTNYNDVDFCLRVRENGLRIVFDPCVTVYHFESLSKTGTHFWELQRLCLNRDPPSDPYWNPQFSDRSPFFELRDPRKEEAPDYVGWLMDAIERRRSIALGEEPIKFSITLSVYENSRAQLKELEATIVNQTYRNWEWVVVDDGSTSTETLDWLAGIERHPKVNLIRHGNNQGIIAGYGTAFRAASGDYVVPVDADDFITLDCLQVLAAAIIGNGSPDCVYSDEDKASHNGSLHSPFLKPDWDPLLFTNICYVCHVCAIKRRTAKEVGAYTDLAATWCHDWDTLLRLSRADARIVHVPEVLYSWRIHPGSTASIETGNKPATISSQRHVLMRHLQLTGLGAVFDTVRNDLFPHDGIWRLRPKPRKVAPVAVILVGDGDIGRLSGLLLDTARALRADDALFAVSHTPELRSALHRGLPELRGVLGPDAVASVQEDLSFAQALARCKRLGYEIVAVMDAAVARMSRDWITEGAGMFAAGAAVGAVSGQVLLPSGRAAWRGGFRGFGGMAGSPDHGRSQDDSGYHGMAWCQRSCDAVPSACFFARTELLERAVVALGNKPLTLRELVGALAVEAWRGDLQTVYTPFVQATLSREIAVDPILPREAVSMADRGSRFYHQAFGRTLETAYQLTTMDSRMMQDEAA